MSWPSPPHQLCETETFMQGCDVSRTLSAVRIDCAAARLTGIGVHASRLQRESGLDVHTSCEKVLHVARGMRVLRWAAGRQLGGTCHFPPSSFTWWSLTRITRCYVPTSAPESLRQRTSLRASRLELASLGLPAPPRGLSLGVDRAAKSM